MKFGIEAAIIAAGLLIAASIAFVGRWEMEPYGGHPLAFLLDRWTGDVTLCAPKSEQFVADSASLGVGTHFRCSELTPAEKKTRKIDPYTR